MKQKSKFTTIKNVILSLIMIVAIGLDCWGLFLRFHGKDKIRSYIFKVGQQTASAIDPVTGEETTEDRWFCEVNIYDNCYEILFNYFVDDEHSEFYSQGLQFYLPENSSYNFSNCLNANYYYSGGPVGPQHGSNKNTTQNKRELHFYYSEQDKHFIKEETDTSGRKKVLWWYDGETKVNSYYYNILSGKNYYILDVSNFASSNNYEDTIYSSNPLDENSYFRIQMYEDGERKPYLMKMKGSNYDYLSKNDEFFLTQNVVHTDTENNWGKTHYTYYYDNISNYRTCDPYYLAEVIYNSCEALDYSSDGIVINFEFGDLFDYYYDTKEIINDQNINNKVKNYITNYYQIKVNKFKGNMTSASQSLFKTFKGSQNYNEELAEDTEDSSEVFTDYHHGRTILDLTEDHFNVKVEPTNKIELTYKIYLDLKDEFKNRYVSTNGYRLRIKIYLDEIAFDNAEFAGFVEGTFEDYSIYKVTTYSTASGELYEEDITWEVIDNV